MTERKTLKPICPCPFCGHVGCEPVGTLKKFVMCTNRACEAEGPPRVRESDAIAAWNAGSALLPKGERVWVAVADGKPILSAIRVYRGQVVNDVAWMWAPKPVPAGITIRRATLIVDPVKPKRRRQP
jgi:hypothetical protein